MISKSTAMPILLQALCFCFLSLVVVDGQTLEELWALDFPEETVFDDASSTFTQTYAVNSVIGASNLGGNIWDEDCKPYPGMGNIYGANEGVENFQVAMGSDPDTAELSFSLDFEKLANTPMWTEIVDGNTGLVSGAEVKLCSRFWLSTVLNPSLEVNFIETIYTLTFDLSAGFTLAEFNIDPKIPEETVVEKGYGADAYLCDPDFPDVEIPAGEINQGDIIKVCVKPNEAALADGLTMFTIDWFEWSSGSVSQAAVEAGGAAGNGLTLFNCIPYQTYCSLSSILFADFYGGEGTNYDPFPNAPGGGGAGEPEGGGTDAPSATDAATNAPSTATTEEKEYKCTLTLGAPSTNELVLSVCVVDGFPQLERTPPGAIAYDDSNGSDFRKFTPLFGDWPFTPDIFYVGTNMPMPDEDRCEGGNYLQPSVYKDDVTDLPNFVFTAVDPDATNYAEMDMRACLFLSQDTNYDGGYGVNPADVVSYTYSHFNTVLNVAAPNAPAAFTMNVHCWKFKEADCDYVPVSTPNRRRLESPPQTIPQQQLSPTESPVSSSSSPRRRHLQAKTTIEGEGECTLAFPPARRRLQGKIGKQAGQKPKQGTNRSRRGLEEAQIGDDEPISSAIGLSITATNTRNQPAALRTSGGFLAPTKINWKATAICLMLGTLVGI